MIEYTVSTFVLRKTRISLERITTNTGTSTEQEVYGNKNSFEAAGILILILYNFQACAASI